MIILTDIDGTLVDYEMNLPASTVKAIKELKQNDHKIYLVSGRSKAEVPEEFWDLGFDGMIGGNGTYIEDHGRIIFHQCLTYEQCCNIVDWCEKRGLGFFEESNNGLFGSERFYEEDGKKSIAAYMKGKGFGDIDPDDIDLEEKLHGLVRGKELYRDDVNKISFVLHSYDDYLDAVKEFTDLKVDTWGGVKKEAIFGDIGNSETDKAKAIEVLLNYLNEDVKDTVAIGDAKADIPMLEYCNIGIALGSGSDDIKMIADYVTDDVDKDGFYKAMKHFELI